MGDDSPAGAAARRLRTGSPLPPAPLQVVGAAVVFVAWRGYSFSWQFQQGQRWDRYAPGLQPGALFGWRVVSGSRKQSACSGPALVVTGVPGSRMCRRCLGRHGILPCPCWRGGCPSTVQAATALPPAKHHPKPRRASVQDLSDVQWREFRSGLPALAALFAATGAASRLLQQRGATASGRAQFYLLVSLAFLGRLAAPAPPGARPMPASLRCLDGYAWQAHRPLQAR